jgi:hypothetical protein
MTVLLDIAPDPSPLGVSMIVGFFLVFIAIAYVVFRLLRKSMKLAFRLAIVGIILLIAVIGALSIYLFGIGSTSNRPRPQPTRTR